MSINLYIRETITRYCRFLRVFGLNPTHYTIDLVALETVIKRYLDDVERLHRYHDIDLIDSHKIAGYLTYWICRLKPIHIVNKKGAYRNDPESGITMKRPFFINELFALFLGLSRIESAHAGNETGKPAAVDKNLINTLIYSLKYRFITGDMLSLTYYMVDVMCFGQKTVHGQKHNRSGAKAAKSP